MMDDKQRTSAVIASELAEARSRYGALRKEIEELTLRLEAATAEMESLKPSWHPRDGRIGMLESELDRAMRLEAHSEGRAVRFICGPVGVQVRSFVKMTEKRIYLSNGGLRDDLCGTDGKHAYLGEIHPDDLRLILAGDVDKLPLVKDLVK